MAPGKGGPLTSTSSWSAGMPFPLRSRAGDVLYRWVPSTLSTESKHPRMAKAPPPTKCRVCGGSIRRKWSLGKPERQPWEHINEDDWIDDPHDPVEAV